MVSEENRLIFKELLKNSGFGSSRVPDVWNRFENQSVCKKVREISSLDPPPPPSLAENRFQLNRF